MWYKFFIMIRISDYPQLSSIVWNRQKDDLLDESEALALYERNWAYVDKSELSAHEVAFLKQLAEQYGNGCFTPL